MTASNLPRHPVRTKFRVCKSKFSKQDSGTKHTLKIIPSNLWAILNNIRGNPSPEKGSKNPAHYHVKVK